MFENTMIVQADQIHKKKTVFVEKIRSQQRKQYFSQRRRLMSIEEQLDPLINNLPTSIEKLSQFIIDNPSDHPAISKQICKWLENNKMSKQYNETILISWTNCIILAFQYNKSSSQLILEYCFEQIFEISRVINSYQWMFLILMKAISSQQQNLQWFPNSKIDAVIKAKWENEPTQLSYVGKFQLRLYNFILKNNKQFMFNSQFFSFLLRKIINHLCKSYYSPVVRQYMLDFLIVLTYLDNQNKYIQIFIKQGILSHFRFLIGFMDSDIILEKTAILLYNFIVTQGVNQVIEEGIISQLVQTMGRIKNQQSQKTIRSTFLLFVCCLKTSEEFDYLYKMDGFDIIIQTAKKYGSNDEGILTQTIEALTALLLRGQQIKDEGQLNPYIVKFQHSQGIQILRRIPNGYQFLLTWNIL